MRFEGRVTIDVKGLERMGEVPYGYSIVGRERQNGTLFRLGTSRRGRKITIR
jgi:hypothetical protein